MNKLMLTLAAGLMSVSSYSITVVPAGADEITSSIARGGRLYDKWYKVIKAPKPEETHISWPDSNTNKSGDATQRCKACHGWDMMGADGAYATGSYQTGIKGLQAMAGAPVADIVAIMKDATHGFGGMMDDQDYTDLANFVSGGQIDIDAYINRETKIAVGDIAKGEEYYNTVCANCHGADGDKPKDLGTTLGTLSNKNPWEIIQKVLNGQPAEQMPAMRAFEPQVSADILAYLQTLPLAE
ncbi:MAG: c-type cytochrome [Marinosulfonomonas sp.]|nr:c-type cytochrome [Marinosulfonomonas sp.]